MKKVKYDDLPSKLKAELKNIKVNSDVLAGNIKFIRENAGGWHSQIEFYKMLHSGYGNPAGQKTVSSWEDGKRRPDFDELLKIAHIGGVSVETLATVPLQGKAPDSDELKKDIDAYTLRDFARLLFYVMPETLGMEYETSRNLDTSGLSRGFIGKNKENDEWEPPCIRFKIPLSYHFHIDRIGNSGKYDVISYIDHDSEAAFSACAISVLPIMNAKKELRGVKQYSADNMRIASDSFDSSILKAINVVPDIPVRPFQDSSVKGFRGIGEKKRPDTVS